jgi:hypothetical protein
MDGQVSAASRVCLGLLEGLRRHELVYARDHAHYAQEMVVFVGSEFYSVLRKAWNERRRTTLSDEPPWEFLWRFDPLTDKLISPGLRAAVTVMECQDPGLPPWGYRIVAGNPASGAIEQPTV